MKLDLNKQQLIHLVLSTSPGYNVFEHPLVKECGYYCGGFAEKWNWYGDKLRELTEEQLWDLYNICNDPNIVIEKEIIEDEYPITEEQRKNAPGFTNLEDILNWELKTSIDNHILGELSKLAQQLKKL